MTTDPPRSSWVQSTAGAIVVNGVIVAVVSAVVTWIINNAASLPWTWILVTFGVVAFAIFLVLSVVRKSLRSLIWRRPTAWLWSFRPVSYRRHARELASQAAATKLVADWSFEAVEGVRLSIPDVVAALQTQISEQKDKIEELGEELDRLAPKRGLKIDEAANEAAARGSLGPMPANIPAPRPRWRIYLPDGEESAFVLANTVDRSTAKEVRLESGEFDFWDGAHWEDVSGVQAVTFKGRATDSEKPWESSAQFIVNWFNDAGVKDGQVVQLDTSRWTPF